ncbi:carbamoyltransferase HypF [Kitasatospora sp. NPDC087315]|uniref:carbamoyltransferase HypF n=1 Tax=Kitasatospora sp. NPDC087315 TaxID=3364069 RepID=UPI00381C66D3
MRHPEASERRRVVVRGVVQGVGFRPFVFSLATGLGLAGHVTNTEDGVLAEIEGLPTALEAFCHRVASEAPPLAEVVSVHHETVPASGAEGFTISPSRSAGRGRTFVPPDVATCADCLAELGDPANRRHRHPFITCTNCGPRFTIVTGLPYDRAATTMAGFPMCPDCAREYADPADRRFHAQPIACHACGPRLALVLPGRADLAREEALVRARELLAAGAILAVKGLGGYHLACDARNAGSVARLRRRKNRGDKPFAVMAGEPDDLDGMVHLDQEERELLTSAVRPIVLLRRRSGAVAEMVEKIAPGSPDLGVLLPYTPLHHLLLGLPGDPAGPRLLVMTSANSSGEPIVTGDREALERLAPLVDGWLTHDRPIQVPVEDSVLRIVDGQQLPLRRSRGIAPLPVPLPVPVRPSLAVGGDLKNVFAVAEGGYAWLSGHVGDMDDLGTLRAFDRAVGQLSGLTAITPELLVADRHPGYRSVQRALRGAGTRPVARVQHHHAHVAAAMAEHGLDGSRPVIGIAFDGTGYGDDGAIWGGEALVADYDGFERFGHLGYAQLPGGDAAVTRPYRMALAWLRRAALPWTPELPCVRTCPAGELVVLEKQLECGLNCVPTSSMGRLFDAVSSLAGVCHRAGYEAQAAIELEAAAVAYGPVRGGGYRFAVTPGEEPSRADPAPVLAGVVDDLCAGAPTGLIAARFHDAVAELVRSWCGEARDRYGIGLVVLTGGVFANAVLASACARGLRDDGFSVLRHRRVPPNDGGLALGQLLVAARVTT